MSNAINFKREIISDIEGAVGRITIALKSEGFGVLTRIDLHSKIKDLLLLILKPHV